MSKEDKIYKPIVDALGITNKKARKKAFDFMNILDYKVPSMGKSDSCKYYACADAACRDVKETFSRAVALKRSGSTEERYQEAFGEVCGVLNKIYGHSMEETAQRMKAEQCAVTASAIRSHFEKSYMSRLPAAKRSEAQFNDQQVVTACLALAFEVHQHSFSVLELLIPTSVSPSQFRTMKHQVRELVPEGLLPSSSSSSSSAPSTATASSSSSSGGNYGGATSSRANNRDSSGPPKKKQKGPGGAAVPAPDDLELDFEAPAPRIRRDMPIDASMAEMVKMENERLAASIKKASMLTTSATSMDVPSNSEKLAQEEEEYQKWKQAILEKAQEQRNKAAKPTKQTTISFAKAPPSSDKV